MATPLLIRAVARFPRPVLHKFGQWSTLLPQFRSFGQNSGAVKFFSPERGFGFIESEDKDYFVHYTGIEGKGFTSLADGESVEFDVELDAAGRERAVRVTGPEGKAVHGATRDVADAAGAFGGVETYFGRWRPE